jgi:hypothetical protein
MSTIPAEAQREVVERLSWKEICRRYPDRWVVVCNIDPDDDSSCDFQGADVIAIFAARKEASPTMKALVAARRAAGCFWTGEIRGPIPRFIP